MQLCSLCAEQRISYHMLAVVSGILSPRLIWLSVFMQASFWNLLMRDWVRLLLCPIALLAVPHDISSRFFSDEIPTQTLKQHDRALNAETPKSAVSPINICLPCSSLTGSSTVPLLPFVYFWHDKCFQLHLHRDWTRDWINLPGV